MTPLDAIKGLARMLGERVVEGLRSRLPLPISGKFTRPEGGSPEEGAGPRRGGPGDGTGQPPGAAQPHRGRYARPRGERAWAERGGDGLEGNGAGRAAAEHQGHPIWAEEARPEGFLVARIGGEAALERAPEGYLEQDLQPPPAPWEPPPLDIPVAYADDAFFALARDPFTLWVHWDFAPWTVQEAREGLEGATTKLRIFQDGRLRRELDFALESRSYYVNDLEPDHAYRAEIYFVGANGERRVGRASNEIRLPPAGPSSWVDDRFLTLPWDQALGGASLFGRASRGEGPEGALRLDSLRGRGASERLVSAGSPGMNRRRR